jgi:hypothetical protein
MRWEAVLAIIGFLVGGERGRAQVNAALTSRAPFHDTKHWPFPMNEWYQHFRKTKGLLPLDATPQASSGQPVLQLKTTHIHFELNNFIRCVLRDPLQVGSVRILL